jgi:hypothetical protein
MRFLGLLLLIGAGCGVGGTKAAEEPTAEFRGGGERAKKIHEKLLRDWQEGIPARFELVMVVDVGDGADGARLLAMGAHAVRPVAIGERGPYGVTAKRLEEGATSSAWLVHAPVEILLYLAELPWVTGIALATGWPGSVELPAEIDRRLDPFLRDALGTFGEERQFAVGGLGEASGCMDDARRRELAGLGAVINSVIDKKDCEGSFFTFEVPLGSLEALAALPWIVQLEGSHPMYIEQDAD